MGVVYEASQESPVRRVAVKLLRLTSPAPAILRRFALEADVLARLQHPHIAQIHLAGVAATPDGDLPYLVMELIDGAAAITDDADRRRLDCRQRVALFLDAVAAVAHAHRSGVVHRDLKPGNILVDSAGSVRVIDFGVARLLAADADAPTAATQAGELLGTVRYMSPEQAGLDDASVDQRSDVYALGLVLHELLLRELPYELRGRTLLEATAIVGRRTVSDPRPLRRRLRAAGCSRDAGSLAVILAKSLEPAARDRYADAGELHADLDRWLAGEPIRARSPTLAESLGRLARRHRPAALAAAVALTALLAAVAGISWFSILAEGQRQAAESQRQLADAARIMAEDALAAAEAGRQEAAAQARETRRQLYLSTVLLAAEARDRDNLAEARRLLAEARSLAGGPGGETPELDCLAASLEESVAIWLGQGGTVQAVAWAPAGDQVAIGTAGGQVWLWEPAANGLQGANGGRLLTEHEGPVWAIAFSPDGRLLASASTDETVRIAEIATGDILASLGNHGGAVYGVAFAPDGLQLASGARDGGVRLWNTTSWEELDRLAGHTATVFSVGFSPDGQTLLSTSRDGTARLWDLAAGRERLAVSHGDTRVFRGVFADDGQTFATAAEDGTARIWQVADGAELAVLTHPLRVNAVAFVPGEHQVATASGDGLLRIWNIATGAVEATRRGHAAGVWSLAIDGRRPIAVTGSADQSCRAWDLATGSGPVMPLGDRGLVIARRPGGDQFAVGLAEAGVILRSATLDHASLQLAPPAAGRINDLTFTADGDMLLAACDDGSVGRWRHPALAPLPPFPIHRRRVYSVAISPDGEAIATASEDRTVRLTAAATGAEQLPPLAHPRRAFSAAFHPAGGALATACEDRLVRLWDLAEGSLQATLAGHAAAVNWVAFSPDGSRLASASSDGTVRLWTTTDDGGDAIVLTGPARQIWKLAFSPGGGRLAACSADGTVQMWDVATGRPVATLRGHTDQVWGVCFAADGRGLFSTSWDGTLRLWGSPAVAALRENW
jgi:WD40 repeat protein